MDASSRPGFITKETLMKKTHTCMSEGEYNKLNIYFEDGIINQQGKAKKGPGLAPIEDSLPNPFIDRMGDQTPAGSRSHSIVLMYNPDFHSVIFGHSTKARLIHGSKHFRTTRES